jgi:hypothetical protein
VYVGSYDTMAADETRSRGVGSVSGRDVVGERVTHSSVLNNGRTFKPRF